MTLDKVQAHRAPWKYLAPAAKWRRAVALVDNSGLVSIVEQTLHAPTGRPRQFTARAFLICLTVHALQPDIKMLLTHVIRTAQSLSPSQLHELGLNEITYPMLTEAFSIITKMFDAGGLPIPGSEDRLTSDQFNDRLIAASIPFTYVVSNSAAIDGTDHVTWARKRSYSKSKEKRRKENQTGTPIPDDTVIVPPGAVTEPGWPRIGADGRDQHTMDPDARDGHRTGKGGKSADFYDGYELHLATQIRNIGGDNVPHIITGLTVRPAGTHRGPAAVRTIEGMIANGIKVTDLCADRGYTPLKPETFIHPLWKRNITVWGDLTEKQSGQHPGPIAGTIWVDGSLFVAALPDVMRAIPRPSKNATTQDRLDTQARFDLRAAYAFSAHGARDADGYQRLKGPALAGKIRCVNVPKSMRLPYDRPTSTCKPGAPCACGKTVTVSPDMHPRERQDAPWGTTAWACAYYRRTAIESTNAEVKTHRLNLARGFTRVFGTVKNGFLLAFAFAGMNVQMLRDWHAVRFLPDPWAVALGEADLGDGGGERGKRTRTRTRTRTRRRNRTLSDLGVAPPPDAGPADNGDIDTEVTA